MNRDGNSQTAARLCLSLSTFEVFLQPCALEFNCAFGDSLSPDKLRHLQLISRLASDALRFWWTLTSFLSLSVTAQSHRVGTNHALRKLGLSPVQAQLQIQEHTKCGRVAMNGRLRGRGRPFDGSVAQVRPSQSVEQTLPLGPRVVVFLQSAIGLRRILSLHRGLAANDRSDSRR